MVDRSAGQADEHGTTAAAGAPFTQPSAFLWRTALLAVLWWIIAEGRLTGWGLAVVAVATATWASLWLVPPGMQRFSAAGFVGFVAFFVVNSLRGGVQVAWMALRRRPGLRPAWVDLRVTLPPGAPRVLLLNALGLMPGTLGVRLDGETLRLHVLDVRLPVVAEARALEAHIGRLFGAAR
jgi:multicomponent Na+:H+ antiporter subunit E